MGICAFSYTINYIFYNVKINAAQPQKKDKYLSYSIITAFNKEIK